MAKASAYSSLTYRLGRIGRFLKAHMSTIVRVAIIIYLTQAVAGFAVGLILPWLQFFRVI